MFVKAKTKDEHKTCNTKNDTEISDQRIEWRSQRNTIWRRPESDHSYVFPILHVYTEQSPFHDHCTQHHSTRSVHCWLCTRRQYTDRCI